MIKRVLTLVNAMNITPRIRINDAAGPRKIRAQRVESGFSEKNVF